MRQCHLARATRCGGAPAISPSSKQQESLYDNYTQSRDDEYASNRATVVAWLCKSAIRQRLAVSVKEQEAHAKSSRVLESELRLAEMMAGGAPIREVLDALTHAI